jgi:Zn-dependent peptidase ImmA (M78 family)
MTISARDLLASVPDVEVRYTQDQAVLRGRNAQWFPQHRIIAMRTDLRGKRWRCSIVHELAHVILEHPAPCGNDFFDQRVEAEADALAARILLPDLDVVARELAVTAHHGHAAAHLGVICDLLDVRLATLTAEEREHVDRVVWSVHEGIGA